ncbi:MAG: MBL fold metallo-hydrolase [Acidobacteriota bacterium]|nr:MBL fold metallo-hydrolase [Acidobacteriota bacterium]
MHRTTLGDFELTVVSDGLYYLDGGAMFGVVPKPMWEKKYPADAQNRLHVGMNSLVVRTGEHTILIETGAGRGKLPDKAAALFDLESKLLDNLHASGFAPEDFDIVINTHLHFDHSGWNTTRRADGHVVPTFPNARYYFQRGELVHAHQQHERDRVSYLSDNYDPLLSNGQAILLNGDAQLAPGVRVALYPGHTEHHQIVILESQGKTAAYAGDLIPTAAHLQPTWVMGYDLSPIASIDNRHRYYRSAIPERWLTVFTHDPNTVWATITRDNAGRYTAEPLDKAGNQISMTSATEAR